VFSASVLGRAVTAAELGGDGALYRMRWQAAGTGPDRDHRIYECPDGSVADVVATVDRVLRADTGAPPLVVVTGPGDLAHAAARGLVRAAQAAAPGRFVLVETDGSAPFPVHEPEVAVRSGQVLVPRLVRATPGTTAVGTVVDLPDVTTFADLDRLVTAAGAYTDTADRLVLVTTVAGVLPSASAGARAAADAVLHAIAQDRRARGLSTTAVAVGAPTDTSAVGLPPLTGDAARDLLAMATRTDEPLLVALRLDHSVLRAMGDDAPAALRGLVRTVATRVPVVNLRAALADRSDGERERAVLELVLSHVAEVLGHTGTAAVGPDRAFQDLGFDSLAAVELRSRLAAATGTAVPATLVFDHPSPRAAAKFLLGELTEPPTADPVLADVDRLAAALAALPAGGGHDHVTARLEALLRGWRDARAPAVMADLARATDDELFDALDSELGTV
jgi:acyl carrier protein